MVDKPGRLGWRSNREWAKLVGTEGRLESEEAVEKGVDASFPKRPLRIVLIVWLSI